MDKAAQGDDTCLDLLRAACRASLDANIPGTLQKVEGVAAMVMRHMRPSLGPEETVRCINAVLYDWHGFMGTQERYYHPATATTWPGCCSTRRVGGTDDVRLNG